MNVYEKQKFEIIEKLEKGEITRKEAAYELDLSLKQIDRLKVIYRKYGETGFIHKNRGKVSKKQIDYNLLEELKNLYLDEYYDYNLIQFYEELIENEKYKDKFDISYSSLYNKFLNDDIVSPLAHKGTIKLYNEKMNNAINNEEKIEEQILELYESRQISFEKAHIRRSSNRYAFGQEVQIDACFKLWFGL